MYQIPQSFEIASCGVAAKAFGRFRETARWADIIHYHFPWPFADLLHFASGLSQPCISTYHSDIVRQRGLMWLYRPLMVRFLERMQRIVATSPDYVRTSATLSRFSQKVEVIPLGLNRRLYPIPAREKLEALRALVGEGFFLFIGVLRYYKGLPTLLEAMRGTDLRAVIVGKGPMEDRLRQMVKESGLNNVQLLGYVGDEEKVALIKLARSVVLPSHLRSEAFGVSLLEGAMYGKPLISTHLGTGTTYVNLDGATGLVVEPGDARGLREAMEHLSLNRDAAEGMGHAARKRFEELFTGKRVGEMYARLYQGLIAKKTDSGLPKEATTA